MNKQTGSIAVEGNVRNFYAKSPGDNCWINNIKGNFDEEVPVLAPGIYKVGAIGMDSQPTFTIQEMKDELLHFKDGVVADILTRTQNFFSANTTKVYNEMKIAQQMGLLLYGPHGTGKSCTALVAMDEMVTSYGCVCLDMTGKRVSFIKKCISELRTNNPQVPLVIFVDEFDESVEMEEARWLILLDGTDSIDRCIFIGCTNNVSDIPPRIKDRKSRIKHSFEVKHLPDSVYRDFISKKRPGLDRTMIEKMVYLAVENGLVLDEVKHALIDHCVDAVSVDVAFTKSNLVGVIEK